MIRRRFQRGSICKRGKRNKVWEARYWESVIAANGEVCRVRRAEILGTFAEIPTRRQAEQILASRLLSVNSNDYRPVSRRTLRDFAETCWLPEVRPTWKYSTGRYTQYILRVHLYPMFGETQLRLITREAVQNFLYAKLQSGLSWRTVKGLRTTFGTLMAAAEMAELIPSNPVRKTRFPRRGAVRQRAVIAPEKIQELLAALPEPSCSIAWLLVLTGLRIGELLAVRWRNVDLDHGTLRVSESVYSGHFDVPKTERSQRTVPLAAKAIQILAARKPAVMNPEALVFATRDGSPFADDSSIPRARR
jgi:integrase